MSKEATVQLIQPKDSGVVEVRFAKLEVVNGEYTHVGWHRTTIVRNGDVDAQIAAAVAPLAKLGYSAVPADDIENVKKKAHVKWAEISALEQLEAAKTLE